MIILGKGISVYLGMNYTLSENIQYIKRANNLGCKSIFTSLHIPEADYKKAINDFKEIASLAYSLNMDVIADISPRAFTYIGGNMNDLKAIKDLGIYGVRVDFGFSAMEIAEFTRNKYNLRIEINASTVTKQFLKDLGNYNPDFTNIQACHNYYPRLNTGISVDLFKKKNNMLKKFGMKISAFIPCEINKRGPIFEGLPTLEKHRFLKSVICAKELYAIGIDDVIFGDSIPSDDELESVLCLDESSVNFNIDILSCTQLERNIIFKSLHQNRPDPAEDVIRSTNSRTTLGINDIILAHNNIERKAGYITIDNKSYLRYAGELQVCRKDLPPDNRVNVVGKIIEEELFLLDYINEETKFKFKENI